MKLRVTQSIDNEDYVFVFELENISSDDAWRISKYGEPDINFGGSFNNGQGITFTLTDNYRKMPSEFPVRIVFSETAPFDVDTATKLALYRTTLQTTIETAVTSLRDMTDTFTGEYVTVI